MHDMLEGQASDLTGVFSTRRATGLAQAQARDDTDYRLVPDQVAAGYAPHRSIVSSPSARPRASGLIAPPLRRPVQSD